MGGAVPSVWCVLYAMHVSTGYAPGRVYLLHSSLAPAWLLSRGSQELGRRPALLRPHACVRSLVYFG